MTQAEIQKQWAEIMALAETAFRQAVGGGTPDRDVSGALAERVIAFDKLQLQITEVAGDEDGE